MNDLYMVYIKTNADSVVTDINSDAFISDFSDWTKIDEGYGDKYHHAQGNYLPLGLTTDDGIYQYKYTSGKLKARTDKEIQADRDALPPAPLTVEELSEIVTALLKGEG